MTGLPYDDEYSQMQNEALGLMGSVAGRGIGGEQGAIIGQKLATGGLSTEPWRLRWTPPTTVITEGQVVAVVGALGEDGSVTDLDTGAPVDTNAAVEAFLGGLLPHLDGLADVNLDKALRQLAGDGPIHLDGYPDRRLASVVDAGPGDTRSDGSPFYWNPDDPHSGPLSFGDRIAPMPARQAPAPFKNELGRMYGGYEMPAPIEPPSIFNTDVFGESAPGATVEPPSPPPGGVPAPSAPVGRVSGSAPMQLPAGAAPPVGVSAPMAAPLPAPRAAGGVIPGTPVAQGERMREPPPRPVGSLAVPFDLSPAGPEYPGDGRLPVPARLENEDGATDEIPGAAEIFGQALLGTVEAVPELVIGTLKHAALAPLYLTPVGIPLLWNEFDERTKEHGGGASGALDALNDMFNPFAGIVHNVEDAIDAYDNDDARTLANRVFKVAIEVLGMAALLRGGIKEGALGDAAAAEEETATQPVKRSGTPGGKPRGSPTKVEGSAETRRSLQRENETAEMLAEMGYDVEQNPGKLPNGKMPDYVVEGEHFDCYAPRGANVDAVRDRISDKVRANQAQRIVVHLDDSSLGASDIRGVLSRKPIVGLREVLVVVRGQIVQVFP